MQDTQGHSVDSIRNVNDEIAKEQGWQVIAPVREHQSQAEHDLTKKANILTCTIYVPELIPSCRIPLFAILRRSQTF